MCPTSPCVQKTASEAYWKGKDPWHYVKKDQGTYYRYVKKDESGVVPLRDRVGKRVFERNSAGKYDEKK